MKIIDLTYDEQIRTDALLRLPGIKCALLFQLQLLGIHDFSTADWLPFIHLFHLVLIKE